MFKCKLNELCQKRGFPSPEYSYIKYGQDHNPLYKARVIVNESTFKSSSAFRNHKSADNDVAEIAFSHFVTFSQVPIDDMQKIMKLKPSSTLSLSSSFNIGALNETTQSFTSVLQDDEDTKVASFDHSPPSITEANSIKSVICDPNPIKSTDTHLLCNNIRVYTGIHDKMLTEGSVVLPIGYGKWTIVSLEPACKSSK